MAYAIGYKVFVTYQQLLNTVIIFFLHKVIVLIILIAKVKESTWFKKLLDMYTYSKVQFFNPPNNP